jgi:hypothetical protein
LLGVEEKGVLKRAGRVKWSLHSPSLSADSNLKREKNGFSLKVPRNVQRLFIIFFILIFHHIDNGENHI